VSSSPGKMRNEGIMRTDKMVIYIYHDDISFRKLSRSLTPTPVAPSAHKACLCRSMLLLRYRGGPHGVSPTNSLRKQAEDASAPFLPPTFLISSDIAIQVFFVLDEQRHRPYPFIDLFRRSLQAIHELVVSTHHCYGLVNRMPCCRHR